jgi:putative oxidoreductase
MSTSDVNTTTAPDVALCWLRITGVLMLLLVHGLPKLFNFEHELGLIEDPFGLGARLTLSLAIFAEVFCPILIALGLLTRLATLPVLFLLVVSVIWVHPEWSLAEGQFAWLLLIIFSTILVGGSGRLALGTSLSHRWPRLSKL